MAVLKCGGFRSVDIIAEKVIAAENLDWKHATVFLESTRYTKVAGSLRYGDSARLVHCPVATVVHDKLIPVLTVGLGPSAELKGVKLTIKVQTAGCGSGEHLRGWVAALVGGKYQPVSCKFTTLAPENVVSIGQAGPDVRLLTIAGPSIPFN
jgi:hypothetical protein